MKKTLLILMVVVPSHYSNGMAPKALILSNQSNPILNNMTTRLNNATALVTSFNSEIEPDDTTVKKLKLGVVFTKAELDSLDLLSSNDLQAFDETRSSVITFIQKHRKEFTDPNMQEISFKLIIKRKAPIFQDEEDESSIITVANVAPASEGSSFKERQEKLKGFFGAVIVNRDKHIERQSPKFTKKSEFVPDTAKSVVVDYAAMNGLEERLKNLKQQQEELEKARKESMEEKDGILQLLQPYKASIGILESVELETAELEEEHKKLLKECKQVIDEYEISESDYNEAIDNITQELQQVNNDIEAMKTIVRNHIDSVYSKDAELNNQQQELLQKLNALGNQHKELVVAMDIVDKKNEKKNLHDTQIALSSQKNALIHDKLKVNTILEMAKSLPFLGSLITMVQKADNTIRSITLSLEANASKLQELMKIITNKTGLLSPAGKALVNKESDELEKQKKALEDEKAILQEALKKVEEEKALNQKSLNDLRKVMKEFIKQNLKTKLAENGGSLVVGGNNPVGTNHGTPTKNTEIGTVQKTAVSAEE